MLALKESQIHMCPDCESLVNSESREHIETDDHERNDLKERYGHAIVYVQNCRCEQGLRYL